MKVYSSSKMCLTAKPPLKGWRLSRNNNVTCRKIDEYNILPGVFFFGMGGVSRYRKDCIGVFYGKKQ